MGRVAYDVQVAVDTEHCLILHHEVKQEGGDRKQLEPMAKAAEAELGQDALTVKVDMATQTASSSRHVRTPPLLGMCRQTEPRTQAEASF